MYFVRKIGQLQPWFLLLFYVYSLRNDFRDYFELTSSSENPFAGESFVDFVGFGFWPTWLVLVAVFLAALALAWWSGEHRLTMLGGMMITFVSISIVDYFLYNTIYNAIVGS